MLAHQGLHVYEKALHVVGQLSVVSVHWSRKFAVLDELERASESIILNLAEGASLRSVPSKIRALEYALGSALESAACIDIAAIKALLANSDANRLKQALYEVVCMLVGLRKSWQTWQAHDAPTDYRSSESTAGVSALFHHEKLEVYRSALNLSRWLTQVLRSKEPQTRLHRQLDVSFTSVALNIAEGNGRYSELDHRHFLSLAQTGAVKAAAYLDLAVEKRHLKREESEEAQVLVEQVVSMLGRM